MKIIITGATGGLGRSLLDYLKDKNNIQTINLGRNKDIGKNIHSFRFCELSDEKSVMESFESADCVVHCAALSSPWGAYNDFYIHNVKATQNIIKACKYYKIPKIIFISSSSVYFDFCDRFNIKEDFIPKNFVNFYAKTKFLAELECLNSSLKCIILRPRGIFGEYDSVLIPRIARIAKKGFLPLIKNKEILCDVTYSQNVAHAIFLALNANLKENNIFNITNNEPLNIKQIYEKIGLILNLDIKFKAFSLNTLRFFATLSELSAKLKLCKEPLLTHYALGLISYSQTLDTNKAKEILGYKPIYSIDEGLKRYVFNS
ncbi:epimerase [Helicobacter valdiviensis]|uniref:Epimerase n=1 Tax=Helicobacter valdiviensis TaxID=1458358 RepID=A0A2W6NKR5_9HELI|nr:NAD(P)-dependent oxidoreductase [Helicobacter valdiviensis]PZT47996.1 epimerase [Helicobacter valdiviensis]